MRLKAFLKTITGVGAFLTSTAALPWGETGHRIIGEGAFEQLDPSARAAVVEILGEGAGSSLDEACNWPDQVRETRQWEWSAPLHYVNIPRKSRHYDRQRDCRDGLCVTEGIKQYANELTRADLDSRQRWRALAWVCHLVGDLHQPLHAGFRDDRGGNLVMIEYLGESWNLHQFWDRALIKDRLGRSEDWQGALADPSWQQPRSTWNLADVAAWTDESHALAVSSAYPSRRVIDTAFADQAWQITRQQFRRAIDRLALVLNATLGEGEVRSD